MDLDNIKRHRFRTTAAKDGMERACRAVQHVHYLEIESPRHSRQKLGDAGPGLAAASGA